MNNQQQISDYIKSHLKQGHSEQAIRNHLQRYGWPEDALNEAFRRARQANTNPKSDRSLVIAWLLSFFLGGLGIDRFYLGFTATGVLKLVTSGGLGIWALIDVIRIGLGIQKDKQKRTLAGTPKSKKIIRILTIVIIGLFVVGIIGVILLAFASKPSLQNNARNTQRKVDASNIASAISEYTVSHNGTLPESVQPGPTSQELLICGASCSDSDQVSVRLGHYANTPAAISFKTYSPSLEAPDADTVYIVNNAACNQPAASDGSWGGIGAQKSGAAAILFAIPSGSTIEQHCVSL